MAQPDHANGNDAMHRPDDAIAMLKADHRQVRTLFQQYEDTPDQYLKQIIAEHVFAEQADAEGKRLVDGALQDHQRVGELMADLQEIDDDAAFEARFHVLRGLIETHVEEEECEMFPQAAQLLAAHLEEITVLMQERKAQILAS